MKILSNVSLVKLREYRMSYGSRETTNVSFVKELEREIHLINSIGSITRVMKTGTKLLVSFSGRIGEPR